MKAMKLLRVAALAALAPLCAAAQNPAPASAATGAPAQSTAGSRYTGSLACQSCHAQIYERWKKTPMANVVRDPREHPEAILPDLSKPDPLVKFGKMILRWSTEASGSSATSRKSETITFPSRRSGTSPTTCGAPIS